MNCLLNSDFNLDTARSFHLIEDGVVHKKGGYKTMVIDSFAQLSLASLILLMIAIHLFLRSVKKNREAGKRNH